MEKIKSTDWKKVECNKCGREDYLSEKIEDYLCEECSGKKKKRKKSSHKND